MITEFNPSGLTLDLGKAPFGEVMKSIYERPELLHSEIHFELVSRGIDDELATEEATSIFKQLREYMTGYINKTMSEANELQTYTHNTTLN